MASKTHKTRQEPPGSKAGDDSSRQSGQFAFSGDYGAGGDNESDADGRDDLHAPGLTEGAEIGDIKKKKRKRSKKKNSSAPIQLKQSSPPRVLLSNLFPDGKYPEGEILDYRDENTSRTTGEELRYSARMKDEQFLNDYRHAAEVHRQVRQWAQTNIKPGKSLTEIADGIEDGVRALLGHQGLEQGDSLKAGMGFPTGLSLNNCAAHYNPNAGNKIVLQHEDVLKIDIGVHLNGWIVDSAWTMAFDTVYDNLLMSVKDATNTGIKEAGIDARICDIGAAIQEVMESYEVEIKGKTHPVKAIRNITGHSIEHYSIHGGPHGKTVPFVKNSSEEKMEEGEVFAIETFGSTGRGYVRDELETSHYSKIPDAPKVHLASASARAVLKTINENFGSLPFCRRYLDRLGLDKYLFGLNNLVANGIIQEHPPLCDIKGSYTAQYEHTILLRETCKEVISRGEDY